MPLIASELFNRNLSIVYSTLFFNFVIVPAEPPAEWLTCIARSFKVVSLHEKQRTIFKFLISHPITVEVLCLLGHTNHLRSQKRMRGLVSPKNIAGKKYKSIYLQWLLLETRSLVSSLCRTWTYAVIKNVWWNLIRL